MERKREDEEEQGGKLRARDELLVWTAGSIGRTPGVEYSGLDWQ